jgi:hypothetical protein
VSEDNGLCELSNARNSSFMLVEKIKDEYDCHHVATSVKHNILSKSEESDLTNFTDDMKSIKEFGFNHIIIVGERNYGIHLGPINKNIRKWSKHITDSYNFN